MIIGMNLVFSAVIVIIGLSGIVAQVLLLRVLLVSFYGNELTIGIILANWVLTEALGALLMGRYIAKSRDKLNLFALLQLIFSLALPCLIYLARTFKGLLGVPFGEALGLTTIFYTSFLIMLPIGFCHGALFSAMAKIYSFYTREPEGSIGKVYAWEIAGTIIGGFVFTYIFIPFLSSFQTAFIVSLGNLLICFVFVKHINRPLRYSMAVLIAFVLYFSLSGGVYRLQQSSIDRQWKGQLVLDYRTSVYGDVAVTRSEKQHTFFYNGIPTVVTPYPDTVFVQDFGNLPLLFQGHPHDILLVGGGAGGLIAEMLKYYAVKKLDYAELDPLLIDMVKKYPSSLTRTELSDGRVHIVYMDGRLFLKITKNKYDVILLGLSKPTDLTANRLFTEEFFRLTAQKLRPGGVLAFCLPGSLTFLGPDLRDLNASVLNGLRRVFPSVRVIPGDANIILASNSDQLMRVGADTLIERIGRNNIRSPLLVPAYLRDRLNSLRMEWFEGIMAKATTKINRDFTPFAVFEMLVIWNRQFSSWWADVFSSLRNVRLEFLAILILAITLALRRVFRLTQKPAMFSLPYCIFTSGFFGMLATLILTLSFQVFHGYIYKMIGLFISIFMAGVGVGTISLLCCVSCLVNGLGLFRRLEIAMAVFAVLLGWAVTAAMSSLASPTLVFIALFFISGFLVGFEFTLASKIYVSQKGEVGETAGTLYFADLLGAWLGGMFGSIMLLPILGLFNTCLLVALFKFSSFLLLKK